MKAFILAAGEGRRLRPLTDDRPKPMIEIFGRPLLEYNVIALARLGVTEIFINTHYRSEVIEAHFGDGERFGVPITYSRERELLGTAGALRPVAAFLDETFIVLYGDNLTDCDLRRVVARHRSSSALATLALFWRDDVSASGIVGVDDDGMVTKFLEKPRPDQVFSQWVNAGIMVAEPGLLSAIPSRATSDFGRDVYPQLLSRNERIAAYLMTEQLWWIDSLPDYEGALRDRRLERFATANQHCDRVVRSDAG